ncbi:MAG: hypothetical protein SGCHY_001328 [Lobulomycetales sp.]
MPTARYACCLLTHQWCTISLAVGVCSGLVSAGLFALRIYTSVRNIGLSVRFDVTANVLLSVWWAGYFVVLAYASSGLHTTCQLLNPSDCRQVWNNAGWVRDGQDAVVYLSLAIVKLAIGAGWVSVALFTAFPFNLLVMWRRKVVADRGVAGRFTPGAQAPGRR